MASIDIEREALKAKRDKAYPEGWFQIAYSDEIKAGEMQVLRYFGQDILLYRTAEGKAQAFDPFCPHMGAHLGVGGRVDGNRIVCPFHGWEFGPSGQCEHIPYSDFTPKKGASLPAWPTEERSGIVFVWYSPRQAAPQWDPPSLPQYGQPDWGEYCIRHEFQVRTICQEIVENVIDSVHGVFVHGLPSLPPVQLEFDGPTFTIELHTDLPSVGHKAVNTAIAHGLGIVENHARGQSEKSFFSTYTPIDRDCVDVHFSMLARRSSELDPTGEISRHSAEATIGEFAKDIPIWEAKLFMEQPLVIKDDGEIAKYRSWARQFYVSQPE